MIMSSEQWLTWEVLCAFAWLDRTWDRVETSPVGAPWCLYLQSGLIYFLVILFLLKIDFPSMAFTIPLLLVFFLLPRVLSYRVYQGVQCYRTPFVSICLKLFGSVVLFW